MQINSMFLVLWKKIGHSWTSEIDIDILNLFSEENKCAQKSAEP